MAPNTGTDSSQFQFCQNSKERHRTISDTGRDIAPKNLNAKGCCLVGYPDDYKKLGLKNVSGLVHEGVPQEVFFAMSFDGQVPRGTVNFYDGFKADSRKLGLGAGLYSDAAGTS